MVGIFASDKCILYKFVPHLIVWLFLFFTPLTETLYASENFTKPFIAILDLTPENQVTPGDASIVTNQLRTILVKLQKFVVLDRFNMEKILEEQKFQLSGACSSTSSCQTNIGQILGVEKIISGSLGKLGNTYQIVVYLTDIASGKIESTEEELYEGKIDGLIQVMKKIGHRISKVSYTEPEVVLKNQESPLTAEPATVMTASPETIYGSDTAIVSSEKDIKEKPEGTDIVQSELENAPGSSDVPASGESGEKPSQVRETPKEPLRITDFQFCIFNNVQLYPENYDVQGVRLNLISGKNRNVRWFDIGWIINNAENFEGLQYVAIINYVRNNMFGFQFSGIGNLVYNEGFGIQWASVFNYSKNLFHGGQIAVVNLASQIHGFQVGVVNKNSTDEEFFKTKTGESSESFIDFIETKDISSVVQVGVVNVSENFKGVQVGVVNYTKDIDGLQVGLVNIITTNTLPFFPFINFSRKFE